MDTMLATTDTMTLTRMVVIGRRTNSAPMAGEKILRKAFEWKENEELV
ncbi:MAG: hypothetical protein J6L20_03455 [Bacteroidales bacterium]|nr:hypothetical protein [Bacteroidales bacterium]